MNLQSDLHSAAMPVTGLLEETPGEGACSPLEFRSVMMSALGAVHASSAPPGPGSGAEAEADGTTGSGREAVTREAIEAARADGLREGERHGERTARAAMEAEMQAALMQAREMVVRGVREFTEARERYFAEVEQEVVRLALAIAARVLHREAQVDPLLLSGAVRVALEKMADGSQVVVRVAHGDVAIWRQLFSDMDTARSLLIKGDPELNLGECVLDTTMGTVELGVAAQLEEIERGFFDLLNHRPGRAA